MKNKKRSNNRIAINTIVLCGVMLSGYSMASEQTDYSNLSSCTDPVQAVLDVMGCIESENAECAAAGYASAFKKYHNKVDTGTVIGGAAYWQGAFALLDFDLALKHVALVGPDQVSYRYVETLTFVTGDVFKQHEHALVTLDHDCKILVWDQTGDNQEQKAVQDKVDEINNF